MNNFKFVPNIEGGNTKIVAFVDGKEVDVGTITEHELREIISRREINTLTVASVDGVYIVMVEINFRGGHWTLYNFRKEPRTWKSLDSIKLYLEKIGYGGVSGDINFKLQTKEKM